MSQQFLRVWVWGVMCGLVFWWQIAFSDSREDIEKRIKPIGQVYVKGVNEPNQVDEVKRATALSAEANTASMNAVSGEAIYAKHCVACHDTGIAGAPKRGDKSAWAERQEKGLDELVASAVKGLNAMPPKGTCMSCSNEELKAAIQYMLPAS